MQLRFAALSDEEKIASLKRAGILDSEGKLSSSYGGDGAPTRDSEDASQRDVAQ